MTQGQYSQTSALLAFRCALPSRQASVYTGTVGVLPALLLQQSVGLVRKLC